MLAIEIIVVIVAMFFFALIVTHSLWVPAVLRLMADNNFLITAIEEGTAKAFKKFGKFIRFAAAWEGHYLSVDWEVIEGEPGNGKPEAAPEHPLDRFLPGGLHWIGLPFANEVHHQHLQWLSIRQGAIGKGVPTEHGVISIVPQGDLTDILISRDERPDFIFLKKDVYGITFQDTDDGDTIPLSFIALFTAQVVNPYKALFDTEQWLEQITNFLRRYVKEYVGKNTLLNLVTDAKNNTQGESAEILGYLTSDGNSVYEYILGEWGVRIDHLNLVNFKTSGKRGEAYETAAATKYIKQQEALGRIELAKAESRSLLIIADGEAGRIAKVTAALEAGGEIARELRKLEALEKVGEQGNMVVMSGDAANVLLSPMKQSQKENEKK